MENKPNNNRNNNDRRSGGADNRRGGAPRRGRGNDRRGGERVKPEFDHKVIAVRRVARVVAGGRRFNFSVVLVAGNRKGKVGVGIGKAGDTSLAIAKAMNDAQKNMLTLALTKNNSIAHPVEAKYNSSVVILKPAPARGLVAGSAVRNILELAGVHDVNSKVLSRSKNKLNIARATIVALSQLKTK